MAGGTEGGRIILRVRPIIGLRQYVVNVNLHPVATTDAATPVRTVPYALLQFLCESHSILTSTRGLYRNAGFDLPSLSARAGRPRGRPKPGILGIYSSRGPSPKRMPDCRLTNPATAAIARVASSAMTSVARVFSWTTRFSRDVSFAGARK